MDRQTGFEVNSKKKGGEIMKKVLMLTALVVLLAAPAMALQIKTSKHNLGSTGNAAYDKGGQTTQICIYCHTPHNATQNIPLWNRNNPGVAGFTLYTSSPSLNIPTANRTLAGDSISLFCLSCHDGTAGGIGSRVQNRAGIAWGADAAYTRSYWQVGLSGNLQNDHPVNFNFDNVVAGGTRGSDADIRARTAMAPAGTAGDYVGGSLKFFKSTVSAGAYLECATCHDPHGTADPASPTNRITKFLRKKNDSSSLCLTCHIK